MSIRSTFSCFGLVVHGFTEDELVLRLLQAIRENARVHVVTANPEILLAAKRSPRYWNCLRDADIRTVEGFGLQMMGRLRGSQPTRVTGVDFAERLLKEAARRQWKVALIGGDPGNADRAAWNVRTRYPELAIFAERGGAVTSDGEDDAVGAELRFRLTQFAPDVLMVGFGHPRQEEWIRRHWDEFPSVKIAIGIGGTIDFWSESKKRAPMLFRRTGFEWLWRFLHEPWRWKRMWNAVIVFPLLFVWDCVTPEE